MNPAQRARQLLRSQHHGVLSTLSATLDGYPFGSVVDYLTDHEARPIFLVSALAEHTKNMMQDPRVSLLSYHATHDVQASPRLTFTGIAQCLPAHEIEYHQARYLRYFPETAAYFDLDFSFYRITPVTLRYIGGVGTMCWLNAAEYTPPCATLAQAETAIITHMNQDHLPALRHYCQQYHDLAVLDVTMLGIDCDGFDVRADRRLLRFEFNQPMLDAQAAREALIAMTQTQVNLS